MQGLSKVLEVDIASSSEENGVKLGKITKKWQGKRENDVKRVIDRIRVQTIGEVKVLFFKGSVSAVGSAYKDTDLIMKEKHTADVILWN